MNRRSFLNALAVMPLTLGAAALSGCGARAPLGVAIHPWIGYETLYLARDFGWIPESARLVEGATALDSIEAMQAGSVEAACLTLDEVLRLRAGGLPVRVGLVFNMSAGADVLLARPGIQRLADLAGARIGVEKGATGGLVLHKALQAAGLEPSAVRLIDLPVDRQLQAYQHDEIDAVVTYHPTASRILRLGARNLFDSRSMPEKIFDVLAVHTDRLAGRDAALRALVAAHFRGLDHIRVHRQDAIHRIAARQGISAAEIKQALAGVVLPAAPANRSLFSAAGGGVYSAAGELGQWMFDHGLLHSLPEQDRLCSDSWLPDA